MKDNFRMMVLKMRNAQKAYFKRPSRQAQETVMSLERKVDKWLEENAADLDKLEAYTSGRSMPELAGAYNIVDEKQTEKDT